ncbi:hypothetical protein LS68_002925 [Helicobacter sp. MIT 05-5293]|uniref:hypothetical protein n=1 Tax=Helicobacter sp. MIT 05-5293 TaxID=1548149 RepID=UPI00051DB50E|nr:hypothetical protein [Helicobacter sp. MIT 05-5293]TLD81982.1 hypothetical protein LS68_002925 [Helicobacter sp. MIT 05-5293]
MTHYLIILKKIGGVILRYFIAHPLTFARIAQCGIKIKNPAYNLTSDDLEVKLDSSVEVIEALLEFKAQNPKDFELILEIIAEIVRDYKSNAEFKKALLKILKER